MQSHERNPNLLAGRNRHFGAKTAKPSEVYKKHLQTEIEKARAQIKAEYDAELKRIRDKAKRKNKKS